MIIYTNEENFGIYTVKNEIFHINSILENELKLKNLLISYMDKISTTINKMTNPTDVNTIHAYLSSLKTNLDNVINIISSFNNLLEVLGKMGEPINPQMIIDYNILYKDIFNKYLQNNNETFIFINNLIQYTSIIFPEEPVKSDETISLNRLTELNPFLNLKERTLVISEKNKNVILPFTISELKEIQKEQNEDNESIQNIIEKYYTKPLSLYKNPPFSRFKEAFNLIREKEKGSFKKALDLGLELFFNSNLHPAIITACRNLDELDIYLDYLENGETNKFNCFDIIFDFAPIISKEKKLRI